MTLNGDASVKASADVFNQPHPFLSGPNILTVYPDSKLYQEIQNGNRQEDEELEKILNIPTYFAAKGAKIHSGS